MELSSSSFMPAGHVQPSAAPHPVAPTATHAPGSEALRLPRRLSQPLPTSGNRNTEAVIRHWEPDINTHGYRWHDQPLVEPDYYPQSLTRTKELLGTGAYGQVWTYDGKNDLKLAGKVPLTDESAVANTNEVNMRRKLIDWATRTGQKDALRIMPEIYGEVIVGKPQTGGMVEPDRPVLLSERIDGATVVAVMAALRMDFEKGILPWPKYISAVSYVYRDVLGALAVLDQAGIVHRDPHHSNMMLRQEDASLVLIDFGLARMPGATSNWNAPGPFHAPETAGGVLTARTDVFTVGANLKAAVHFDAAALRRGGSARFDQQQNRYVLAREKLQRVNERIGQRAFWIDRETGQTIRKYDHIAADTAFTKAVAWMMEDRDSARPDSDVAGHMPFFERRLYGDEELRELIKQKIEEINQTVTQRGKLPSALGRREPELELLRYQLGTYRHAWKTRMEAIKAGADNPPSAPDKLLPGLVKACGALRLSVNRTYASLPWKNTDTEKESRDAADAFLIEVNELYELLEKSIFARYPAIRHWERAQSSGFGYDLRWTCVEIADLKDKNAWLKDALASLSAGGSAPYLHYRHVTEARQRCDRLAHAFGNFQNNARSRGKIKDTTRDNLLHDLDIELEDVCEDLEKLQKNCFDLDTDHRLARDFPDEMRPIEFSLNRLKDEIKELMAFFSHSDRDVPGQIEKCNAETGQEASLKRKPFTDDERIGKKPRTTDPELSALRRALHHQIQTLDKDKTTAAGAVYHAHRQVEIDAAIEKCEALLHRSRLAFKQSTDANAYQAHQEIGEALDELINKLLYLLANQSENKSVPFQAYDAANIFSEWEKIFGVQDVSKNATATSAGASPGTAPSRPLPAKDALDQVRKALATLRSSQTDGWRRDLERSVAQVTLKTRTRNMAVFSSLARPMLDLLGQQRMSGQRLLDGSPTREKLLYDMLDHYVKIACHALEWENRS